MSNNDEHQPVVWKEKFICPHCKVLAQQDWTNSRQISRHLKYIVSVLYLDYRPTIGAYKQETVKEFHDFCVSKISEKSSTDFVSDAFSFAKCHSCSETSVWHKREIIYPRLSYLPAPNEDMNDEIKKLYLEAATIFQDSPRASAALLRLSVEKLCEQLGETGTLNACIGNLVKNGLNQTIQQALDYCRVIGNEAVHPGQINIEENTDMVSTLFYLVNDIAQEMITKPREMGEKYSSLPAEKRKQVQNRDGK